jgi:hypothetical protein
LIAQNIRTKKSEIFARPDLFQEALEFEERYEKFDGCPET